MKLVLCATETEYKTAKEFKLPSDCKLIHCGIGKTFASARLAANLAEMNFNCEQVIWWALAGLSALSLILLLTRKVLFLVMCIALIYARAEMLTSRRLFRLKMLMTEGKRLP